MKDRFKFRAWIPEAKHLRSEAKGGMFYQEDQYLYSFIRRIQDQFVVNHPSYLPFELEERLMQSVCRFDKNEKLIYEGDVVRILYTDWPSKSSDDERTLEQYKKDISHIGRIVYNVSGYQVATWSKKYKEEDYSSIYPGRHGEIEIIGNIHQNPELITQTKN